MVRTRKDGVAYVSSGEGTTSQGEFHEAINWASREKLPVLFVIENNKYAISVPVESQSGGKENSISEMMAGSKVSFRLASRMERIILNLITRYRKHWNI